MPTAIPEATPDASASSAALRTFEAPRCLLYIGDDPQMTRWWTESLTSAGYLVTAVDSPAAGLSAYVERQYDGVLLAFHRPCVSSGLLATVMRLFRRSTPLILLADSGASTAEMEPFDRVLPKNTVPAVVIGILQGLRESARRSRVWSVVPFPPRLGGDPHVRDQETISEVRHEVIPHDQP